MKLTYHGATYTVSQPLIETVETDIDCRFLGKTTKLRVPKYVPARQHSQDLIYRGNKYRA
ncbi:MAG: DUF4278 domain-containing protein [Cyanobacteria bacterium J06634_5]